MSAIAELTPPARPLTASRPKALTATSPVVQSRLETLEKLAEEGEWTAVDKESAEVEKETLSPADFARLLRVGAEAALARGDNDAAAQKYQQAIACMEQVQDADIDLLTLKVRLFNDCAVLYRHDGKLAQAEASYIRAINLLISTAEATPTLALLFNNLGAVYISAGAGTKAFETFEKAAELGDAADMPVGDRARFRYHAGVAALSAAQAEKSEPHLTRALRLLTPASAANARRVLEIHLVLAGEHLRQKRTSDALADYESALEVEERFRIAGPGLAAVIRQNLGVLAARAGRLEESIAAFSEVLALREHSALSGDLEIADASYHLSVVHSWSGNPAAAARHADQAMRLISRAERAQSGRRAAIENVQATLTSGQKVPADQPLWLTETAAETM